jgi:hypothetical protein
MPISNKTRKIIWARSGNICSICKAKLVSDKSEPYSSTVFGEECHIISQRPKGPRHKLIDDYDVEDNLIILCANCHKSIDNNVGYYTDEKIKEIRENHQREVRDRLIKNDPNNIYNKVNGVTILPKVNTGKQLLELLDTTYGLMMDYEDSSDPDEIEFMSITIETLTDYADLLDSDKDLGYKISKITPLTTLLNEIDERGFAIFGEKTKRNITLYGATQKDWIVSSVYLMKKENPNVIRY